MIMKITVLEFFEFALFLDSIPLIIFCTIVYFMISKKKLAIRLAYSFLSGITLYIISLGILLLGGLYSIALYYIIIIVIIIVLSILIKKYLV